MQKKHYIFYATISGILLSLPWYGNFSGLLLFFAFVPLLLIEESNNHNLTKGNMLLYAPLAFFVWNVGTTWWIVNASLAGAMAAIFINTLLFSLVFWLYHLTKRITGKIIGQIAFVAYWVTFEWFYLNAEISWPWLNLGNGFAHDNQFVQWYEYTGTLGGTIWILVINLLIADLLKASRGNHKKLIFGMLTLGLLMAAPVFFSLLTYHRYHETSAPCRIAIIQPNMDPYSRYVTPNEQCNNLLSLAGLQETPRPDYFVAPEVTVNEDIWENAPGNNYSAIVIKNFVSQHPWSHFIFGAYTYKKYKPHEPRLPTAQWMKPSKFYFDSYNSALQIDTGKHIQIYHKSKLVVGIEKMPYPHAMKPIKKVIESLGGSFSSYATQNYRGVFTSTQNNFRIAPVICYESVYGEFVAGYVKNGANLIFILTNDGWWGNTPGHRQHLSYARLRAIETRRSIARAANTGISAFINQRGDVIALLPWNKKNTLEGELNANSKLTFYVKYGDYLGWLAFFISVFIGLYAVSTAITKRKTT